VCVDDGLRDVEPQPQTAEVFLGDGTLEGLEDCREAIFRDPDALITDRQLRRRPADSINLQKGVDAQPRAVADALGNAGEALAELERASGITSPPIAPAAVDSATKLWASAAEGTAEAQGGTAPLSIFSSALSNYSSWVDLFASRSAEGASSALRKAFDALADAVAVMPRGEGLAPSEMAAEIRTLAEDFERAPILSAKQASVARHVFERTEAITWLAATRKYVGEPQVLEAVRALHEQYVTIEISKSLRAQLPEVLGSLEAAESVLRVMAMVAAGDLSPD
jgi:hypothetical protein